ncbi:hypothetical protein BCV69DRAFT_257839 [Microstroma glucosiphilum]|uniref:HMA domain-containing protein n=1 Tax=Pseudomicrostroma glucosiphilum TaxID=1684307 RepID=A0A316U983_9BASI|nr:hypothetical protein BCV69DRAFT_257839 [Pseudomicrostroma glucosiphilum]PWN21827.1 hypothetical protein BCV69DRAFT_257839 [Pseudomicrostroma glucosiphilum]
MASTTTTPPTTTYHFRVRMTCSGCSSAITRVLTKTSGLQSFKVDLDSQTVDVIPLAGGKVEEGGAGFEEVKEKIRKTGKEILEAEIV